MATAADTHPASSNEQRTPETHEMEGLEFEHQPEQQPQVVANLSKRRKHARQKQQRKRGVFRDQDGHSIVGKNFAQPYSGTVTLVGEQVTFSHKALPSAAKVVMHNNRRDIARQHQLEEALGEDDYDEDLEPTVVHAHRPSLADFFAPTALEAIATDVAAPLTAEACLTRIQDHLSSFNAYLQSVESNPLSGLEIPAFWPSRITALVEECRELQPILLNFMFAPQDEQALSSMVTAAEQLHSMFQTYESLAPESAK